MELELASGRAASERDAVELHRLWTKGGFLPEPEKIAPEDLMAYVEDAVWWYTTDETGPDHA